MLYRIVDKGAFIRLVDILLADLEVIGPRLIDHTVSGKPVHQFLPVTSFAELDLDFETTEIPAKTYFIPYKENLSTWQFEENDWTQSIRYRIHPRVMIGLHACDINALLKLDKVMTKDIFPSPYYISRRKNTFIIGIDHLPCQGGFCHALGTDTVNRGFDLFLTDLGDRYFVAIDSDRGLSVLQKVTVREVTEQDTAAYLDARRLISARFGPDIDVKQLPKLLDIEFESDVWNKWGKKCFSCGSCAMACPTCYCYGICEEISMDFREGAKVKQLYSCSLVDFAQVAGGHNFRPGREIRLKYRYYHQHRGFVEAYDEPKCVGCGRCGRVCLAGINPLDIIRDLQSTEEKS
jgi:formate hydrogenlyase subunit 6/NADH:ubiquinone oxidoreductase subunit I